MTTVRMECSGLWTQGADDERAPVSFLEQAEEIGHIHGRLTIEIAGKQVPSLGYFGPDDVCLDTWLVELCNVVNRLARSGDEYTFDEGEQGQPAFRFTRLGSELVLSIVDSALSGRSGNPDWQNVTCLFEDFRAAVIGLLDALRAELRRQAPTTWEQWWPTDAVIHDVPTQPDDE